MKTTYTIIAETRWKFGEVGGDPDLGYCLKHATFKHYEDAEFVLSLGDLTDEYMESLVDEMRAANCSKDFIDACRNARLSGANYVCFYA